MAHHKSAKKRIRGNKRKNVRNRTYLSSVRTAVKSFRTALEGGQEKSKIAELFITAQSMLASAATKGILHKNNASRKIGRLANMLRNVETGKPATTTAKKKTTTRKSTSGGRKTATAAKAAKKKATAAKKAATKKK